jgi:hypothetical protein
MLSRPHLQVGNSTVLEPQVGLGGCETFVERAVRCCLNYALAESTWLSADHQGDQRSPGGMSAGSGTGGISAGSWIAGISEGSVTVGIAEGNWTAGMSLGSWTAGTSAGKGNGGMLAGSGRSGSGRTEKLDGSGIVGGAG